MSATIQQISAALGSPWRVTERRNGGFFLTYDGRRAGYLAPGDDGRTGTCRQVTVRAGTVAAAIRKAGLTV